MRPLNLEMTNFMCYAGESLDFTGVHVACLTGENGAGKSTLLDAMTWALWGQARNTTADEVVRLGEDECAVTFSFEFDRQCYRVIRQRKAGKSGRTVLSFQIRMGDLWTDLSGDVGVRDTQAEIDRVLGLGYDTFVNSAFLRQGRADEFTVKTPAERKRVLADILGLDRWSAYETCVKGRMRDEEGNLATLSGAIHAINDKISDEPDVVVRLEAARADVADFVARLAEGEGALAEFRELQRRSAELGSATNMHTRVIADARDDIARWQRFITTRRDTISHAQDVILQRDEIEQGLAALRHASKESARLEILAQEHDALVGVRRELEVEIAVARSDVERRAAEAAARLGALRDQLGDDVTSALANAEDMVIGLPNIKADFAETRATVDTLTAMVAQDEASFAELESKRAEIEALMIRVGEFDGAQRDQRCPTCGQFLDEEHRKAMLKRLSRELQENQLSTAMVQDSLEDNRARLAETTQRLEVLDMEIRRLEAVRAQLPDMRERAERWMHQTEEIERLQRECDALALQLSGKEYAESQQAELVQTLSETEALGYDPDERKRVKEELKAGQAYFGLEAELNAATTTVATAEKEITDATERVASLEDTIANGQAQLESVQAESARISGEMSAMGQVEAEINMLRQSLSDAQRRLGAAEQELAEITDAKHKLTGLEEQQQMKRMLLDQYASLREAFGVKGVPAMIIEAVIPEIEAEANMLLARMTSGRMHVRFDTQRETQAGDVRETLMIQIADELGTREYSMYSGGEAFRVNFAIRVALSRVLARRAGARLQTLVIDEGFGTQDEQGRDRLVEAINAVRDDFACVLVVTHIGELRDAFPVRIDVAKMPGGSRVQIS